MKFKIVILLVLGLLAQSIKSQTFSSEPEKFFKDVSAYLNPISKEKSKDLLKEFEVSWLEGTFTDQQRKEVYVSANKIVGNKLKPFPDFSNYLDAIMYFQKSGKTTDDFQKWHETLNKVLEGRNKSRMQAYLETSKELFNNNTIFSSSSTVWKASNNNYKFLYDNDPYIVFDEMDLICYSKNDSSVLYKTKGTFYPISSKWIGVGGKLTWERANFSKDTIYALLTDYEIGMKSAGYTIDSVEIGRASCRERV